MSDVILDAGALIAFERSDRHVVRQLARVVATDGEIVVPAGVVAQVWRNGARQVRLARLMGSPNVAVEVLDGYRARAAGQLCGESRIADIVDASVVLCARERGHVVMTSDPHDLRRIDPHLELDVV